MHITLPGYQEIFICMSGDILEGDMRGEESGGKSSI